MKPIATNRTDCEQLSANVDNCGARLLTNSCSVKISIIVQIVYVCFSNHGLPRPAPMACENEQSKGDCKQAAKQARYCLAGSAFAGVATVSGLPIRAAITLRQVEHAEHAIARLH
jgi:hypothetical protein